MEQTRQQVLQRLGELKMMGSPKPTASSLHVSGGLGRAHRRELKRHKLEVSRQDVRLTKKLSEIDRYLQSVEDYNIYLAKLPVDPLTSKPTVLPKPIVVIGLKPIFKETKFSRYSR